MIDFLESPDRKERGVEVLIGVVPELDVAVPEPSVLSGILRRGPDIIVQELCC